jgi:hypothetical protein
MFQFQMPRTSKTLPRGIEYHSSDYVDIMFNMPQLLVSYVHLDEEQGEWGMTRLCMHWDSVVALSVDPATQSGSIKVMLLSPASLNGDLDSPWSLDLLAEIWRGDDDVALSPIPSMRYVLADGRTITFAFDVEMHRQWQRLAHFKDGVLILDSHPVGD